MATTYEVRIWNIEVYKGKRTSSYIVWWRVGVRRFKERYKTQALADSFRSELVTAARKGEASTPGARFRWGGPTARWAGTTSPAPTWI